MCIGVLSLHREHYQGVPSTVLWVQGCYPFTVSITRVSPVLFCGYRGVIPSPWALPGCPCTVLWVQGCYPFTVSITRVPPVLFCGYRGVIPSPWALPGCPQYCFVGTGVLSLHREHYQGAPSTVLWVQGCYPFTVSITRVPPVLFCGYRGVIPSPWALPGCPQYCFVGTGVLSLHREHYQGAPSIVLWVQGCYPFTVSITRVPPVLFCGYRGVIPSPWALPGCPQYCCGYRGVILLSWALHRCSQYCRVCRGVLTVTGMPP